MATNDTFLIKCPVPAGATGVPMSVKYNMDAGLICGGSLQTVYISDVYSNVEPGVTVYSDSGLTTLLTGYAFITNVQGLVYNLNAITAIVVDATGADCGF